MAEFLGLGAAAGSRTVASFDEDTTTMAVEAARGCVSDTTRQVPGRVIFGTTRPAYREKTNATAIRAALDLPEEWSASDTGASIASAAAALDTASDLRGPTLLVLADSVRGRPGSNAEASGGDGGVAFVFNGAEPPIATVVGRAASSLEVLERWSAEEGGHAEWEARFGEHAFSEVGVDAIRRALSQLDSSLDRVDHAVFAGMNARASRSIARAAGLSGKQRASATLDESGNYGSAHAGLGLAAVLDVARPGETIVICTVGDGVHVVVLRVEEGIERARSTSGGTVSAQLGDETLPVTYSTFLRWGGQIELDPPRRPEPESVYAPPALRRSGWKFAFQGTVCRECGAVHLPPARRCRSCGSVDKMIARSFADTPATVSRFTIDHLAYSANPPLIPATVDFFGGGRFRGQMTDVRPEDVHDGMAVEMTFRLLGTVGGIRNYFWKVRPRRNATA